MRAHNSTIKLKKKECKSCGKQSFIFSKGRCQDCARIEGAAKSDSKEAEIEFSGLVEDLDIVYSRYLRQKHANGDGLVQCFTCPTIEPVGAITCGHFIGRAHMFLRWDERNTRPQCDICNCHKHGNMKVFAKNLEAENPGIVEILREESRTPYKWSKHELMAMIKEYTNKLKLLKK